MTPGSPHLSASAELRPTLAHVLQELQGMYDLVLLDVPPILLSADAELLISCAAAALLIISAERGSAGEIRRAASLLERLAPPVVGAVLNRVRVYDRGGYYAQMLMEYETRERAPDAGFLERFQRG
jgi:Mrp family chromosome partitioning ATPase